MAKAIRAADIRGCVQCFDACGKCFGLVNRSVFVKCGVGINNCRRGGCCGLGCCCAEILSCCAGCCKGLGHLCCTRATFGFIKFLFVAAIILVTSFVVYVHWDSIVTGFDTARNGTTEYYDKARQDPTVVGVLNKTNEYYEATKDKITEFGSRPEVQQVGNKTVELYGVVKNKIADTFEQVHQSETVQNAINGTVGFFSSLKDKLFG